MLFDGEAPEQLDERLVLLQVFRLEARDATAEVHAVEGVCAHLASEKALAEGAEGNESDPELLERRQDRRLGLPVPERVFALQCRDRLRRGRPRWPSGRWLRSRRSSCH